MRALRALLAAVLLGGAFPATFADTVSYEYDALGRLKQATHADGSFIRYTLDPAGNRTQVAVATLPGIPASITVPSSSSTGAYTISWGAASGTVTAHRLYEATVSSFSGQVQVYSGTALSAALSGRGNGTYYYRVQACNGTSCSAYRTGSNGVVVSTTSPIQVLNPSISVNSTGQQTQIAALANLNGHPATIHSFTENCSLAGVAINGGGQYVVWTNSNYYYWQCEDPVPQQCSASYVIRNSTTGQLHSGTASITVVDQGRILPPGQSCLQSIPGS